ncbi:EAL domain-containing protein [Methylobacillus gramineus]|uniref:EAL and HDOD domain-containing protein n=1 Tax=Methylobacillus gramineus TaxID=755169 RepID=UPI001CFF8AE6|nr:EAL domain-containing protein [Methylobacillus gramineus]MCB5183775.1 EAL domain-containing protein [Methylobacillus gramineus]
MRQDQAFIGRQPIMNINQDIVAYELFFRHSGEATTAVFENSLQACTRVLVNTISDMGSQWLLGDKMAFINVSEEMLQSEFLELLPPARTVLELSDITAPTTAVVERCHFLRKRGYKIALKDKGDSLLGSPLIDCADFIKIDTLSRSMDDVARRFLDYQSLTVKIVAEKVERQEQYEACKKIGFHLIQGFYFAHTETFTAKVINPAFTAVLDLLNMISRDADMKEVENGFKRDAALSFKLLRYINSVGFGLSCEIQSIRHALTIIGTKQLYRWLTLLMVTAGENSAAPALMKTSITRGRLTELLGDGYFDKAGRDNLFVVGVFSMLDRMLEMPMEQVLEKVDLPEAVHDALLHRQGIYGPFLELAEACENQDGTRIIALASNLQLDPNKVNDCHIASLAWVEALGI